MKKRLISLLLICSMLFTLSINSITPTASAAMPAPSKKAYGVDDAVEILKKVAGLKSTKVTAETTPEYDLDCNYKVDVDDAVFVLKGVAKINKNMPARRSNITAQEWVKNMGPGWNLGNNFDSERTNGGEWGYAISDDIPSLEASWLGGGNGGLERIANKKLIQEVKKQGFGTIRIPVTWYKVIDRSKDYKIRADWMARVKEVVDWALAEDLNVILNTHHEYRHITLDAANRATAENALKKIWEQIATEFKDYSHKLIFEGLNEPHVGNDWQGNSTTRESVNRLNQVFVDAVRATKGYNAYRVLLVPTYAAGAANVVLNGNPDTNPDDVGFKVPKDKVANRIIMSVHSYTPGWFCLINNGEIRDNWDPNEASHKSDITTPLDRISATAKRLNVPVILGEIGSVNKNENEDARAAHAEFYFKYARSLGFGVCWWDVGRSTANNSESSYGLIDRGINPVVSRPKIISAIMKAY